MKSYNDRSPLSPINQLILFIFEFEYQLIFTAINKRNLTREDLDIDSEKETLREKLNLFW